MVIRNKDGSEYKLKGPNPLLNEHDEWQKDEKIEVFNFDKIKPVSQSKLKDVKKMVPVVNTHTSYDDTPLAKIIIPEVVEPVKEVVVPKPVTLKPDPVVKLKSKPKPDPVVEMVEDDSPKSHYRQLERSWLNCLPAVVTKHIDKLYGEEHTTVEYRRPFKFQGAILSSNDLQFSFWTTIEDVKLSSVVYHGERRRWWKVTNVQNTAEKDGFIISCVPSDLHPDFSL